MENCRTDACNRTYPSRHLTQEHSTGLRETAPAPVVCNEIACLSVKLVENGLCISNTLCVASATSRLNQRCVRSTWFSCLWPPLYFLSSATEVKTEEEWETVDPEHSLQCRLRQRVSFTRGAWLYNTFTRGCLQE